MGFLVPIIGAGYGAYLLYAYARGALYFYIHPIYVLPTLVTGLVLLALAAAAGRHGHARVSRAGAGLLVVPLALGFGVPPRPLGIATASQRGIAGGFLGGDAAAFGRLDQAAEFRVETNPESYTVKDWVVAMQRDPEPARHAGKPVRVTGFVYRDAKLPEGWFVVARFVVQCCAVDATPLGIPVRGPGGRVPPEGGWVAVDGAWEVVEVKGERRAVVAPTSVAAIERPERPYLY
jgi:putative membrane protein